ncbi:non-ribosomal peptide synthetase [Streptomyces sp. ST2-7A]|uniref:non-ribosomal peptide synthetase n=1 Tax=Streptomyces sp. ST2-7A TaxID=2907214 RepID=UPI001F1776BB|nr:non-ribosomal peptide synthetase [Streptomyces sp. ST2-7A]MCE7079603.1 amino acid adenylation domain-containing protein [Streptomyces sp. ST2-7A]
MSHPTGPEKALDHIVECVAEVLGTDPDRIVPGAPLVTLGLESFTAVRLRRRIRERTGRDLPLTALLGEGATAERVVEHLAGDGTPGETSADVPGVPGVPGVPPHSTGSRSLPGEVGKRDIPVATGDRPMKADVSVGEGGDEPFPLTPIQASYLAGRAEGLPLGGVATHYYHEYDRTPPNGDPEADLARLRSAWARLVAHHPMLRMTVDERGAQRILPVTDAPVRIDVTDLRSASADDTERTLDRLRDECSHRCRPTGAWPLFEVHAAFLPDGRTRLHVGVDVLCTDMAGWMLLMRQWGLLVEDPDRELPAPSTTFAAVQRARADDPRWDGRRRRDRDHWAERVPHLPPAPALPVLRDPADTTPPRFTRHEETLAPADWAALRARAAESGVTPTATLLASLAVVLERWGAGSRICLNTTVFDRPDVHGDAADVVGDFTTTALIACPEWTPGRPGGFAALAAATGRRFWEDLDHGSVSGVEVLRELVPRAAAPDGTPAFPVVFTSGVGLAGEGPAPHAWIGREVYGVSQTPQVLLDHIVRDEDGRLRIAWDHVVGAFPEGWIPALAAAQGRLLRRLTDPAAWTDPALGFDPSFLPAEPLDVTPFPRADALLDGPLRSAARRRPERPAVHAPGVTVTHERLAASAEAGAALLAAHGVGPGERVAVACEKTPAQIAAVLGVHRAGAAYVPVEPSWPTARVAAVCHRSGIRHALVGRGVDLSWPDGVTVHRLNAAGRPTRSPTGDTPALPDPVPASPGDLAYTIFTSGSTGTPKGVDIEHRAARTTVDDIVDRFSVTAEDRVLALSALSFDLSVFDIYGVLGAGGSLVLPDPARRTDPQHWLEQAGRHGVTIWNTAPALLEMLVEYAEMEPEAAAGALRTLRLVMLSGDWIPLNLPDRLRRLAPGARFMSLGGATEASIWSITHPVGRIDPQWRSVPYGRALRGQTFHVLDEDGVPCPVGTAGELYIGGDGLARGYTADPEQTAERFAHHPVLGERLYRTGDLGRWTPAGVIEFLGRADRQVKIRGHRIEPGEIEAVLGRHPGVRQCLALARRGRDGRPRLVAHIVPRDSDRAPDPAELASFLSTRVPDYMVPNRFVSLDRFPVTANGKIDHAALTRAAEVGAANGRANGTANGAGPAGEGEVEGTTPVRDALPAVTSPVPAADTAPGHWAARAVERAAALGLEAALVVRAGALPPARALEAASRWVASLPPEVGIGLAGPGLAEAVHRPPTTAGVESTPAATPSIPTDRSTPVTPSTPADPSAPPAPPVRGIDAGVLASVVSVLSDLTERPVTPEASPGSLGATSLTLVLAHRRLRESLAPDLALADVFRHPTVGSLAEHITALTRPGPVAPPAAPDPGIPPARRPSPRRGDRAAARARAEETAR